MACFHRTCIPNGLRTNRDLAFLESQVRALLRINAGLKGHSRDPNPVIGAEDDWIAIAGKGEPLTEVEDAQFFLRIVVNEWLRIGQVGFQLGIVKWSRTKTGLDDRSGLWMGSKLQSFWSASVSVATVDNGGGPPLCLQRLRHSVRPSKKTTAWPGQLLRRL